MRAGKAFARYGVPRMGNRQCGFTLVAVLAALFLLALATNGVVSNIAHQAQREREAALLRTGQAYADAIGNYYEHSPGAVKRWPARLEDLLDDKRSVVIRRYIRKLYPDPVTRSLEWGLVSAAEGGISGVYSRSDAVPIRSGAIDLGPLQLQPAARYTDWQFVHRALAVPSATGSR